MTIAEFLERFNELVSNSYGLWDEVKWLSDLDCDIRKKQLDAHEDGPEEPFVRYDIDHDEGRLENTTLIAGPEYFDMYSAYCEAKVHYYNQEIDRYNNATAMYRDCRTEFNNEYNRLHKPKASKMIYW